MGLLESAMQFYRSSAARQAARLAITIDKTRSTDVYPSEEPHRLEIESPTLAGYIVYVVTVLGFLTMCVSGALR